VFRGTKEGRQYFPSIDPQEGVTGATALFKFETKLKSQDCFNEASAAKLRRFDMRLANCRNHTPVTGITIGPCRINSKLEFSLGR
jgi:hypothetical protein